MTQTDFQLPKPLDWPKFERICKDLWEKIWNAPNIEMHGRTGQRQNGVDIYAIPAGEKEYSGVQCKLTDRPLTKKEIEKEVNDAKQFRPPLRELIIATTAPNDVTSQQVARDITEEHAKSGLFSLGVFGWAEIQHRLSKHPDLLHVYYPHIFPASSQPPTDALLNIASTPGQADTDASGTMLDPRSVAHIHSKLDVLIERSETDTTALNVEFKAELDEYKSLLHTHQERTAIAFLENLRRRSWGSLDDPAKFRLLTNIGAAHLHLGQQDVAAKFFSEAHPFAPDDEKSLCNLALSFILRGDPKRALELAQKAYESFPSSAYALSLVVAATHQNDPAVDPTALIPDALQSNSDIAFSVAVVLRRQGRQAEARQWTQRAYQGNPESIEIRMELAASLLDAIVSGEEIRWGSRLSPEKLADAETVITILTNLWDEIKKTDIAARLSEVAVNLSTALQIVGRLPEANAVAREANEVDPEQPDILHKIAGLKIASNEIEEAVQLLNDTGVYFPEKLFLLTECYRRLELYDEALNAIGEFIGKELSPELIPAARAFRLELLSVARGFDVALSYFQSEEPEVHFLVTMAGISARENRAEEAYGFVLQARELISEDSSFGDRIFVAEELYAQHYYDEAIPIYKEVLTGQSESLALRHYIDALLETDRRREALQILEAIPEDMQREKFYKRSLLILYVRSGMAEQALEKANELLEEESGDFEIQLVRIGLLQQLDRRDEIVALLEALPALENATGVQRMRIAHLLAHYATLQRGQRVGYETLRDFEGQDPHVEIGYQTLFYMKEDDPGLHPKEIEANCAVTVEFQHGSKRTIVIEAELELKPARGEVALQSPLAQAVLGKSEGDDFDYAENEFQTEHGRITQIRHKYIYALHRCTEDFSLRYPTNTQFVRFSIDTALPPEDQLSPVMAIAKQTEERFSSAVEIYKEQGLPVAVVAKLLGGKPAEVWSSLAQEEDVRMMCCIGTTEEREEAIERIRINKEGFVADQIALLTMYELGIHRELLEVLGDIGVCRSTVDAIRVMIAEGEQFSKTGRMAVGSRGGRLYNVRVSKEDIERGVEQLRGLVAWIEDECSMLPAVPARDPENPNVRRVLRYMDGSYADVLMAAQGSERLLLSDDYYFRQLGRSLFGVEAVWLQAALIAAQQQGKLESSVYSASVVRLILGNLWFIRFGGKDLLWLAEQNDWKVSDAFRRVVSRLGDSSANRVSCIVVAADFLALLWLERKSRERRSAFTYAVLSGLTGGGRGDAVQAISAVVERFAELVKTRPVVEAFVRTVHGWASGHFLIRLV